MAFVGNVGNATLTNYDFYPGVAMGPDGNVVVTWSETADAAVINGISTGTAVYARAFNSQSAPLWDSYYIGGGGLSTIAMDDQDNFVLSWEVAGATDPNGFAGIEEILGSEYQLESYTNGPGSPATGVPLPEPVRLRPVPPPQLPTLPPTGDNFRFNSADPGTPTGTPTLATTWPLGVTGSDVQMDADGDIAATYDGNGPAASVDVAIPNTYFEQYFSQEVQKLTFTGVAPGDVFALEVGSAVTSPITFGTSAAATAPLIYSQLNALLLGLGFSPPTVTGYPAVTVTGTQSGTTWTFTVTFGIGPNEPLIGYVGSERGRVHQFGHRAGRQPAVDVQPRRRRDLLEQRAVHPDDDQGDHGGDRLRR